MNKKYLRSHGRVLRQARVRDQVKGTTERPRLCVYRSNKYTYAQLISDDSGQTLTGCSTQSVPLEGKSPGCVESAKTLGLQIAKLAREKNIERVVFDRNGFAYHGRVKAVADGARKGGLQF